MSMVKCSNTASACERSNPSARSFSKVAISPAGCAAMTAPAAAHTSPIRIIVVRMRRSSAVNAGVNRRIAFVPEHLLRDAGNLPTPIMLCEGEVVEGVRVERGAIATAVDQAGGADGGGITEQQHINIR